MSSYDTFAMFRSALNRNFILVACLIPLAACSTIPPVDFTVENVGVVDDRKNVELRSLTVGYASQNQQRKMEADATIPPVWKEALSDAIARSLIFKDDVPTKINLSVRIVEFDVPGPGFAMTTKVAAIYEIIDRSNGDLLFSQEIASEGSVPMGYAFNGAVRMVESWNRAVRNNIADFINQIEQADLGKAMFLGNRPD